ncbi:MAG TPA: transglycosylase SLT domain-containing protein [Burkholderiales bacterium]|nr:transglycosylase SLT domain-containing protein [Burkholderiales bacterium]
MRKILLAFVLGLLQACASQQPLPEAEPMSPGGETPAPQPAAVPRAAAPALRAPAPVPPKSAAPAIALPDASRLPPFDGQRVVVEERLRGVIKIDRTVAPEDLWQRIRHGFAIPDLKGPLVRRKTAEYAAGPEYLQRILDRSRLYLFHIVEEIEKRGLPTELALLPMVESAFNPMAYSRAHASGLWQFIPGTGKRYDLKQNWWYDGRRDVVDSTNAALDYLTKIYEMHGDWHLALASYNWGENAVKRAVAKNRAAKKPTDYASLKMPKETSQYIPKLQALKNIIANPEPFGIDLDPIPNQPYFAFVTETPDIDVQLAARFAEMPLEEFVALNPGFSRPLIRASMASRIVLPADKVEVFHANLAKHDDKSLVSWQAYQPKEGETLAVIAKKFNLGVEELKRVNGIAPRSWAVLRVMVVPSNGSAKPAGGKLPALMYAPPIPVHGAVRGVYVVKRGDSLSSIAARHRVSVAELNRWNKLGPFLQVGQKIHIRKTVR